MSFDYHDEFNTKCTSLIKVYVYKKFYIKRAPGFLTVGWEYAAYGMERCVDTDYPETRYDAPKSSKTWTNLSPSITLDHQSSNKGEASAKVSRTKKKIAGENRSVGRSDTKSTISNSKSVSSIKRGGKNRLGRVKDFANSKMDISAKKGGKRVGKLNVLKSRLMSARRSVQNNTKTLYRNVPDRLGKYVSTETKLSDYSAIANTSNDCLEENGNESDASSDLLNSCPETKLNMIDNECLSNKESVTLGNNIESDSGSNNIFEKIFDDCLGSTSVVNDASSQETLNLEADDESVAINPRTVAKYTRLLENFENFKNGDKRINENEKTPVKKTRSQPPPKTPVKVKDHNSYHGHKKIRHVCGYCHKIFKSNGKLNSHVFSHTGEKPFDCNNCGKAFSSKFKLVRHLLIHSEIRKFVCQICDRTFLRNDHLKNHYKVHDPQKKMYKCPKEHCEKEYSSVMSYKKHMAYHNVEDGDLKCLICNVKFEAKEEVLFHLKSHSGSRLFKSQSDKKFKCDFCDRLFLTRKDVTRHLVVHTGERDFLCQFCPQRFGRKDHLVRHIKKSHINENVIKNDVEEKKACPVKSPTVRKIHSSTSSSTSKEENENNEKTSQKTHIVITVKNPVHKKGKTDSNKNKPFRKSDSSVPIKKQVPLLKNKNSTTEIFLENIPNILIIPNNSIILLRNQSGLNKAKKPEGDEANNDNTNANRNDEFPGQTTQDCFQLAEDTLPRRNPVEEMPNLPLEPDFNSSYTFSMFQTPQCNTNFNYLENYGNIQPEMTSFGQQFDPMNFGILNTNDFTKRNETGEVSTGMDILPSVGSTVPAQVDHQRKVGIVKPVTKSVMENTCGIDKDLFTESSETLIMNDSILSDFKVDDSVVLDNDGGMLNLYGQGGIDATGNELLRNLFLSENPILSPLPGFSQIFHNSNAN